MKEHLFSPHLAKIASFGAEAPLYLRPEQITLPANRNSPSKSLNNTIRLAESIKKYGILEPLTVKAAPSVTGEPIYELIEGSRRLRAAISAGITQIPCILRTENAKSETISNILANLQARKLNIFEQAAALRLLMQDFCLSQKEIAHKIGVSQSTVANKLRLLQLSHSEQRRILASNLTERHARALLCLNEEELREYALNKIIEESMTVASAEKMIGELLKNPREKLLSARTSLNATPSKSSMDTVPRKFAMQSPLPLYNSIERTLSIFRKTGAIATCQREEGPCGVRIVIEIPKNT